MAIYVLDSSALHRLPGECASETTCGDVLEELTSLADGKGLCICTATVHQLKVLCPSSSARVWAAASVKTEWFPRPDWKAKQQVATELDDYADWDLLTEEPEVVEVLALAASLDSDEVVVVTEDDIDKPDILSTTSAADRMGIGSMGLDDFLAATGLDLIARP